MIALFDLDGVVMDTETQYTYFWDSMGKEYLGVDNFCSIIKGQALFQIFGKHYAGMVEEQKEITEKLNDFEANMVYDYIPGVLEFMKRLKEAGVLMAIVTSSNELKMNNVRRAHPELWELMDAVVTSEFLTKSKPDPECFIKGMEILGGKPEETYVFEDSIHGLNAGRASGANVIGLATTNPREVIEPLCDMAIDDFTGFDVQEMCKAVASR